MTQGWPAPAGYDPGAGRHDCPGRLCGGQARVPADMLMCGRDWRATPKPYRSAVWRAWQDGRGRGSAAHRAAMTAAIEANHHAA